MATRISFKRTPTETAIELLCNSTSLRLSSDMGNPPGFSKLARVTGVLIEIEIDS